MGVCDDSGKGRWGWGVGGVMMVGRNAYMVW